MTEFTASNGFGVRTERGFLEIRIDEEETWRTIAGPSTARAIRQFFEKHPQREPWEDAQPEEGWIIEVDGKEWLATVDVDFDFTTAAETFVSGTADMERITAARRIWPVSDD